MAILRHQSDAAGGFAPARLVAPLDQLAAAPAAFNRMAPCYFPARRQSVDTRAEQRHLAIGARAIAGRIIPRLVASHPPGDDPVSVQASTCVGDRQFAEFTQYVMANDTAACQACIDQFMATGATFGQLCLDLLTRTARALGAMWDEDACGFFEVTEGLGTLHTLLHRSAERYGVAPPREAARRVLLASLQGEQHSFGLQMVGELFRHAGWDVVMASGADAAGLASLVAGGKFAVAGLSVADIRQAQAVARVIRTIRRASANAAIGILLGGPAIVACPELVAQLGADAGAADARQAIGRAETLASTSQREGAAC